MTGSAGSAEHVFLSVSYSGLWVWRVQSGATEVTPKAQATEEKDRSTDFQQNLKLLCYKGDHQENEQTTHRMEESMCKSCI